MFKARRDNAFSASIREFYCPSARECCRFDAFTPEERDASAKHAYYKVLSKMKNLFFWGYPLDKVVRSNFFENLSQLISLNFGRDDFSVEVYNTLIMFALYQDKTSRIVQAEGYMNGQTYQIDWVEFCHHDLWYAVGFGSFNPEMDNRLYRSCDVAAAAFQNIKAKKLAIIEHDAFWESTIIKRLNYLLRDTRTSRFWLELCYTSWSDEMLRKVNQIEDLAEAGRRPNYAMASPILGSILEINQARIDSLMHNKNNHL
ncbi:MAG: hypothetical protein Q4F60_02005 [Candidatus Saccharibacteria bacterium]|nr:hypothetical protein [Candidatus Saccharibacteria bacterium]